MGLYTDTSRRKLIFWTSHHSVLFIDMLLKSRKNLSTRTNRSLGLQICNNRGMIKMTLTNSLLKTNLTPPAPHRASRPPGPSSHTGPKSLSTLLLLSGVFVPHRTLLGDLPLRKSKYRDSGVRGSREHNSHAEQNPNPRWSMSQHFPLPEVSRSHTPRHSCTRAIRNRGIVISTIMISCIGKSRMPKLRYHATSQPLW
jgi:hypothetical protein